jgi:ABC-type antimicrobial peptide transport system permease subunit
MAFSVTERSRELAIRAALGATPHGLRTMIVRSGLTLAVSGTVAGLVAALALTRLLSAWLFAVGPNDPLTFSVVSVGLVGIGLVASWIPAWRAAATSPVVALQRV